VNEIQMRMVVGDAWPASESCWYYDHDGPDYNWRQISLAPRCRHYYETDGKPRTWMTETADLTDRGSTYWTVFSTTDFRPYMAYGYLEGGQWKYVWVYAGSSVIVV